MRPTPHAQLTAENIEDRLRGASSAADLASIGFKHLHLAALADPDTRQHVAILHDEVEKVGQQLAAAGWWKVPPPLQGRRSVALVLRDEELDGCVAYLSDGISEEYGQTVRGHGGGGGLSPLEWALLPVVLPFLSDLRREQAEALLALQREEV